MSSNTDSLNDFKNQVANVLGKLSNLAVPERFEAIKFMKNTLALVDVRKNNPEEVICAELSPEIIPPEKNQHSCPKKTKKTRLENLRLSISNYESTPKHTVLRLRSLEERKGIPHHTRVAIDNALKATSKAKAIEHKNINYSWKGSSPAKNSDKTIIHSTETEKIKAESVKKKPLNTTCVLCGKVNHSFTGLIQHLFDHEGTPISCFCCKKSFSNAIAFEYHKVMKLCNKYMPVDEVMRVSNTSIDRSTLKQFIVCPFCSQRNMTYCNLKKHVFQKCFINTNTAKMPAKEDPNASDIQLTLCKCCPYQPESVDISQCMDEVPNTLDKFANLVESELYEGRNTLPEESNLETVPFNKNQYCYPKSNNDNLQCSISNYESTPKDKILQLRSLGDMSTIQQDACAVIDDALRVISEVNTVKHNNIDTWKDSAPTKNPGIIIIDSIKIDKIKPKGGKKKTPDTSCVLCGKRNQSFTDLIQHLFDHEGVPKSCFCCKKSFSNAIGFEYHKVMCLCSKYLSVEEMMDVSNVPTDRSALKRFIVCPFCSERFMKYYNLKRHLLRKCLMKTNLVNKPVKTKPDASDSHSNLCKFCQYKSDTGDILQHMKEAHNFLCTICNEPFHTMAILKRHMYKHKEQAEANHHCVVCHHSFFTRKKLRLHKKEHTPEEIRKCGRESGDYPKKKVNCDKCPAQFTNTFSYHRHCKRVHLPATGSFIVCEKCGKKLYGNAALQDHVRQLHTELLSCNECQYKSSNKTNLLRHKELLHGVTHKKFSCQNCSAQFALQTTYKEHLKSIHSDERGYTCYICTAKFKVRPLLKRHLLVHESPALSCPHCPMLFRRTDHRDRHISYKHKTKVLPKNEVKSKKRKVTKVETNPAASVDVNMQMDQVFSLIDVQSGELVTLSVTDMSRNSVLNMSGGELINTDNIPVLWNNLDDPYTLEPLLPTVVADDHYAHPVPCDTSGYAFLPPDHTDLNQPILKPHQTTHMASSSVQHMDLDTGQITDLDNIILVDNKTNILTSPLLSTVNVLVTEHIPLQIEQNMAFLHESE